MKKTRKYWADKITMGVSAVIIASLIYLIVFRFCEYLFK